MVMLVFSMRRWRVLKIIETRWTVSSQPTPLIKPSAQIIIGPDAFKLVKNLCGPTKPSTKIYDQLKNLMNNHYNPEPVVIAERHKFWTALQEESEAVCDFIVRLQKLARTCGFGGFLQEALRDRLVSGLYPKMKKIQYHLLAMRDLSFQTAREKCVADELATKANDLYMGAAAKGDADVNLLRKAGNRGHGSSHSGSSHSGSSHRGRGPEILFLLWLAGTHEWRLPNEGRSVLQVSTKGTYAACVHRHKWSG